MHINGRSLTYHITPVSHTRNKKDDVLINNLVWLTICTTLLISIRMATGNIFLIQTPSSVGKNVCVCVWLERVRLRQMSCCCNDDHSKNLLKRSNYYTHGRALNVRERERERLTSSTTIKCCPASRVRWVVMVGWGKTKEIRDHVRPPTGRNYSYLHGRSWGSAIWDGTLELERAVSSPSQSDGLK